MKKSKRIALGGWLNNVLSIATRGWFGGGAVFGNTDHCAFITFQDKRTYAEFTDRRQFAKYQDTRTGLEFTDHRAFAKYAQNGVDIL